MLVRGDLPQLRVTEQPARSAWRRRIVTVAQPADSEMVHRGLMIAPKALPDWCHLTPLRHSPLWVAYFPCRGTTREYRHDKSFLMSRHMPELYKSFVFSWNTYFMKHTFFIIFFHHHAPLKESILLPLDDFGHFPAKAFRAKIAASVQRHCAEKETHKQHANLKINCSHRNNPNESNVLFPSFHWIPSGN